MQTKTCLACKETKPRSEFYPHPTHKDRLSTRCIICTKADMHRRWVEKHPPPPPKDGLKNCPHCNTRKERTEFYKNRSTHDGLQGICKTCQVTSVVAKHKADKEKHAAYQLAWSRKNPSKKADIALKVRLGLPHGSYATMLAAQSGRCAICGKDHPGSTRTTRFHVDHDKETGGIRGLLCGKCNTGIGQLQHSEEILQAAILYLRSYQPKVPVDVADDSMRARN